MSADAKITAEEIAGAVHDVRQMLSVITGRVGLLSRHAQDPLLKKNLDALQLAAEGAEQRMTVFDHHAFYMAPISITIRVGDLVVGCGSRHG